MPQRDLQEFRQHYRPLAACFLGMGSALALNNFVVSSFAPYIIGEFGWTRAQWALTGTVVLLILICIPIAGRMADRFGVRRVAGVGMTVYPLTCIAIAMMNGSIWLYIAICVVQAALCCTTTATVYTRLVAGSFAVWRGVALAICGCSPAVVAAIGSPLITGFVAAHGWRAGYLAIAAFSALCAIITFLLIPAHTARPGADRDKARNGQKGYREILGSRIFWMLLIGTFLVSLPHTLVATQLKLVVLEQGLPDASAAFMVSLFAGGVIVGRLLSGFALDYFPPHSVAAIFLGFPAIGMVLLASGLDGVPTIATAIILIGFAFGGEGDVIAYLVVRAFGIEIYSTVLGLLTAAMATASAAGAALLSVTLARTGSFNTYLLLAAAGVFTGSVMFQMIGSHIRAIAKQDSVCP